MNDTNDVVKSHSFNKLQVDFVQTTAYSVTTRRLLADHSVVL